MARPVAPRSWGGLGNRIVQRRGPRRYTLAPSASPPACGSGLGEGAAAALSPYKLRSARGGRKRSVVISAAVGRRARPIASLTIAIARSCTAGSA